MAEPRIAILDPAAGISGDMFLGALLAVGAPRDWLEALPARLGLDGVRVEVIDVVRCGIQAVKVTVRLHGGESEGPGDVAHHHPHEHGHHDHAHAHHDHPAGVAPHSHVAELLRTVERAPLSPWVKDRALRAFRLLAEAEGRIHGVPPDDVALHEVAAADALVDIVGGIEGFERLGIERIYTRPVALGEGWVHAAHGVLPVPAPVTALLLEGVAIRANGPVTGEATTPTGAVLLRVLAQGAPPDRWRATGSGWGAGGRDPHDYPNALRLLLAVPVAEAGEVTVLATDLDDMSPEYLEPLREALTQAGALDVQTWPTQMKKGRVGVRIEVLAAPSDADSVAGALFRHSTTAGIRRWTVERSTLARRELTIEAGSGLSVRVKVLDAPDGVRVKAEYEDVAAVARQTGRPALEVAREVQERALRLAALAGPVGSSTVNQES